VKRVCTGTKVQILTQKALRAEDGGAGSQGRLILRQYLYFCTSKASKLSTAELRAEDGGAGSQGKLKGKWTADEDSVLWERFLQV
jgi:hypothetical protein